MSFVAIIGAGEVGGALAFALACRDGAGEIRLIDPAVSVAAGNALDIQQSAPVELFHARLSASADPREAIGAAVTILADPAGGAPASAEESLAVIRHLARLDARAVFVGAMPAHRLLVERGTQELGIPRTRLIGSAPAAYASAVRALVAASADVSPSEVSLTVLGVPPHGTVVPWSGASIGGSRLDEVLAPAVLAAIRRRVDGLWPPGPYALASAAARVAEAIVLGSRRRFACFVTLEEEFGARGRAAAMTVELGPGGVNRVIVPVLSAKERVALETALAR